MTFEDDFPSLRFGTDSFEDGNGNIIVEMEENWHEESEIKKHCLDKIRVREAIDKIHPKCECAMINILNKDMVCYRCQFFKKLNITEK